MRGRFGLFTKRAAQLLEREMVPRLTKQFRVNEMICEMVMNSGAAVLPNPALKDQESFKDSLPVASDRFGVTLQSIQWPRREDGATGLPGAPEANDGYLHRHGSWFHLCFARLYR